VIYLLCTLLMDLGEREANGFGLNKANKSRLRSDRVVLSGKTGSARCQEELIQSRPRERQNFILLVSVDKVAFSRHLHFNCTRCHSLKRFSACLPVHYAVYTPLWLVCRAGGLNALQEHSSSTHHRTATRDNRPLCRHGIPPPPSATPNAGFHPTWQASRRSPSVFGARGRDYRRETSSAWGAFLKLASSQPPDIQRHRFHSVSSSFLSPPVPKANSST
jgi:hypothetical protein